MGSDTELVLSRWTKYTATAAKPVYGIAAILLTMIANTMRMLECDAKLVSERVSVAWITHI